ncbi:MAG: hypothetical protein ACJ8HQ_10055 [Chthoniobacterales bacterium]
MRHRLFLLLVPLFVVGCVGEMPRGTNSPTALANALTALSPTVRSEEANRVAEVAYARSTELAREYRIVGPAVFQNGLVNTGLREKGLCYHWTEDLLAALQPLDLKTLQIHWAIAHPGSFLESNALVLTARGQPLEQGIVLDGWRHAGRLYWNAAAADRAFGWHEDRSDYARSRLASPTKAAAMHKVHRQVVATSR